MLPFLKLMLTVAAFFRSAAAVGEGLGGGCKVDRKVRESRAIIVPKRGGLTEELEDSGAGQGLRP